MCVPKMARPDLQALGAEGRVEGMHWVGEEGACRGGWVDPTVNFVFSHDGVLP